MKDENIKLVKRPTMFIVAIVLVGVIALLITLYLREKVSKIAISKDRDLIFKNLDEIKTRYDKVVSNADSISKQLQVVVKKNEKITDSLGAAKAQIFKVESMKNQIEILKKEEKRLSDLSNYLARSNKLLDRERDSVKKLYEKEKLVTDSIMPTYKKLASYYNEDSEAVVAGTITNLHAKGYTSKKELTTKSKKVSKLEICYSVLKSHRLKEGKMRFFIKMSDSKGRVLGNQSSVSNTKTGTRLTYTIFSEFDYKVKDGIDVCTQIDDISLFKGNYSVEIFDHNLYPIGKTVVFFE